MRGVVALIVIAWKTHQMLILHWLDAEIASIGVEEGLSTCAILPHYSCMQFTFVVH